MLAFDAHLDLAWNAIDWNRDLSLPAAEVRKAEAGMPGIARGNSTVTFPEMRRGRVAVSIATLLPRRFHEPDGIRTFHAHEAAYGHAQGQLAYYRAMAARGVLRPIGDRATLDRHLSEWEAEDARRVAGHTASSPPLGYILSMEGAYAVLAPEQLGEWFEAGLRIIGPAHYAVSPYAHGTGSEGGLLPAGRPLLKAMRETGMILDVTHLADQAFWEALDAYDGPVLASHHNCRALVPGDRQLSDDQIRALVARGAVIGASFDNWMLLPGWQRGKSDRSAVSMEHVADHIDRVCQLAGDARHSGLGTDLDGGFGKEQSPSDLDTIADLQRFPAILARRGYSADDIRGIMYGNWVRFFREAWKP